MFLSNRDYILILTYIVIISWLTLLYVYLRQGLYPDCQFCGDGTPALSPPGCPQLQALRHHQGISHQNFSVFLISRKFVIITVPFKESGAKNQKTTHRQKRDRQIASLLIILVIVFGVCNIVRVTIIKLGWKILTHSCLFFLEYLSVWLLLLI